MTDEQPSNNQYSKSFVNMATTTKIGGTFSRREDEDISEWLDNFRVIAMRAQFLDIEAVDGVIFLLRSNALSWFSRTYSTVNVTFSQLSLALESRFGSQLKTEKILQKFLQGHGKIVRMAEEYAELLRTLLLFWLRGKQLSEAPFTNHNVKGIFNDKAFDTPNYER